MILGEISGGGADARTTLDDILRLNAARRPDAIALIDPPNRAAFTDGEPRCLTYAQADRMVSAIAERLRGIGLPADSVVATHFANTSESILALLGIMRAGMIAAPMPMLWRRADCVAALSRIGTKALMTCARVGGADHASLAMQVAAEIFPIRHVCGFGASLPEGLVSFDDLFDQVASGAGAPFAPNLRGNPALHVAAITFDMTPDGIVPVARSHAELLAGGLSALAESRLASDSTVLSSLPAASFAGIALTLLPWLLSGGTLRLHQPFDAAAFVAQLREQPCDLAILPGSLVARLADAELFRPHGPKSILAFWRAPERLALSAPIRMPDVDQIDVAVFGEIGLCAMRRADGQPAPIPSGKIRVPGAAIVADIARTSAGTIGFGGPMAPHHPFPPHAVKSTDSYFKASDDGVVDTGYPCRPEPETGGLVVTGPPAGLVSVGGYRFSMRDVQDVVAQADKDASVAALPDIFAGHRLAGDSKDRAAIRHTLAAIGLNPLIMRAFRERNAPSSATSPTGWHEGFRSSR